jgi:hypothetical protein
VGPICIGKRTQNPVRRFLVEQLRDGGSQLFAPRQNYGSLYKVLQFPDIAGPAIPDYGSHHVFRDMFD